MPFFFLTPLLIPVIAGVLWVVQRKHREEQNRIWGNWARARNWLFHPTWPAVVGRFQGGPFGVGTSRRARLGWEGHFNGLPVIGFVYQWSKSTGDSNHTYHRHVMGIRFDHARFPWFQISHRGIFGKGITFENAMFNELWDVDCQSRRFAHDFMTPRSMELLLRPHPPFRKIWLDRDHLLLELDSPVAPDAVDAHLMLAFDLLRLVPDFLYKECGTRVPRITQNGPGVTVEEQRRRIAAMEYQHRISVNR